MGKQDIKLIDYELIRELRRAGQYFEAQKLLDAHHNNLKKAKENELKSINMQYSMVKKTLGLCASTYCINKVVEGRAKCKHCLEVQRRVYHRKKKLLKSQSR